MTVKKIDATRPFYAVVGATDLAVELARGYSADVQARVAEVQARVAKLELEPKALGTQARGLVAARIDGLNEDARAARTTVEARTQETRTQIEAYVNDAVAEVTETYGDLAARGRSLVSRIRRQQATQDAQAATRTTVAKARTARTQTTRSAKGTASTAKGAAKTATRSTTRSAKQTAGTAKTSTKATRTSALKAAGAGSRAVADAAQKVGD